VTISTDQAETHDGTVAHLFKLGR